MPAAGAPSGQHAAASSLDQTAQTALIAAPMREGSMTSRKTSKLITRVACATTVLFGVLFGISLGTTGLVAGGTALANTKMSAAASKAANPYHLIHPGTLTVGMDLVFKPEMYLSASGQPAGYDVALLDKLAAAMHLKLKIDNLDFTGLIPGLEAKKFDVVSVGLSPTPRAREGGLFQSRLRALRPDPRRAD